MPRKKDRNAFFEKFVSGEVNPDDLSEHSINNLDRFDKKDWHDIHAELVELRAASDELHEVVPTGRPLMSDAFWSFFKVKPDLVGRDEIKPDHLINLTVMEQVFDLTQWTELRRFTRGDDVAAGMACVSIEPDLESLADRAAKQQELVEQFKQKLAELMQKRQDKMDVEQMYREMVGEDPPESPEGEGEEGAGEMQVPGEGEGEQQEGQGQGQQEGQGQGTGKGMPGKGAATGAGQEPGSGGEPTAEELQQQIDQLQQQIDQLEAEANAAGQDLQEEMDDASLQIRSTMAKAMADAAGELRDMSQSAESWGLEPGSWQRLPAKERFELAKRLNSPRLQRIAELFGPMKEIAFTEQQRKVEYSRTEVVNITQGNDINALLPTELLRIRDPRQRSSFYRDFAEGKLLQYHLEGKEKVGKGGIILLEDGSGSMQGEKEMWAKAVMLCLLHIARKQNRKFTLVHFGSPGQIQIINFEGPGDFTTDRILLAAELFFNGGTDFETPFNAAIEQLQSEHKAKGHIEGDIVMVTDGICGVSSQWDSWYREEQARLKFATYGVIIGGAKTSEPLYGLCDGKVASVKDLASGGDVREVFRGV